MIRTAEIVIIGGGVNGVGTAYYLAKRGMKRIVLLDRSENGQFFLERELRSLASNIELDVCIGDITDQEPPFNRCLQGFVQYSMMVSYCLSAEAIIQFLRIVLLKMLRF